MISGIGNDYNTQNVAGLHKSGGISSSGTSGEQSSSPQSYAGPDYVNRIGEKRESDKSSLYAYENAKKHYESEKNRASIESRASIENGANGENKASIENRASGENKASTESGANAENKASTESRANAENKASTESGANADNKTNADNKANAKDQTSTDSATDLTAEEEKVVSELEQRDREVRAHEQQHVAAGGGYAGSPSYTYERGPDNKQYAVGGSVSIDISPVAGDPEATIRKAEIIRKAALAPAEPSAQDKSVASSASAMANEARQALREEAQEGEEAEIESTNDIDQGIENNSSSQTQGYENTSSDLNLGQGEKNTGYANANSMERKPRADAVAAIYQNAQNMNSMLGAIVPWGTNLSIFV